MSVWLAIPILITANWLTGALLLRQFPAFTVDRLARLPAAIAFGVGINGWLVVISAEFGFYSPVTLALLWLLPVSIMSVRLLVRDIAKPTPAPQLHPSAALLLLWLPFAAWLFLRPHEFVIGSGDAGVYVNLAANIDKTGSIVFYDQAVAELDPALHDALLYRLPQPTGANHTYQAGFFATDPAQGEITPQFYPLHPAWQAVAYTLGGLDAALLMTGMWALLSSFIVYLTARDQLDWRIALLALAGLTVNALQIWFARYPTTEPLTQFLLWTGIWALGNWLGGLDGDSAEDSRRVWALLAGIMLGQTMLARIDMLFILAVPVSIAVWLWLRRHSWTAAAFWWFALPLSLYALHAGLHGVMQSRPYFNSVYGFMLRVAGRSWYLPLAALLILAVTLFVLLRFRQRIDQLAQWRRPFLLGVIGVVVLLALYGWFIRPNLFIDTQRFSLEQENLVRLGWYLSPIGIALSVAGACYLIWHINQRTFFTIAIGLFFALLYLWSLRNNPRQIYAMRRLVPAVLPFAMIAAATVPGWFLAQRERLRWVLGIVIAVVWLGALAWSARGFVTQRDFAGVTAQIEAVNAQLEPRAVLLIDDAQPVGYGDFIGTPLRFLFDHDVFTLHNPADVNRTAFMSQLQRWHDAGRPIYWMETPDGSGWPLDDSLLQDQTSFLITFPQMEVTLLDKPDQILDQVWAGTIWRVNIE
ncbi:MAG: hypothetical protein M9918_12320 [Anaerolineae bacterium]|nr:hypothetical protein [Anaerolineae bacterium]